MILSANMLSLLSRQYAIEVENALRYASLMTWSEMRGLDGTSAFFEKQSVGESDHAAIVLKYIHSRNEQMVASSITWPGTFPESFVDQFLIAQETERATTEALSAIYAQATIEGDCLTSAWLMQASGLLMEQIEEERIIQTILDRVTARRGLVPLNGLSDTFMAELPGEIIHDIDVWIKDLK